MVTQVVAERRCWTLCFHSVTLTRETVERVLEPDFLLFSAVRAADAHLLWKGLISAACNMFVQQLCGACGFVLNVRLRRTAQTNKTLLLFSTALPWARLRDASSQLPAGIPSCLTSTSSLPTIARSANDPKFHGRSIESVLRQRQQPTNRRRRGREAS